MIRAQKFPLHLEEGFWVAHMAHQIARNLRQRLVSMREDRLPCLENRVAGIPRIQIHMAVIGVDGCLHRIAHVVGFTRNQGLHRLRTLRESILSGVVQIHLLRVRVLVGNRVGVQHPFDSSIHHRWVHARVNLQVRCHTVNALDWRATVENLRVRVDAIGEEHLQRAELNRIDELQERVGNHWTTITRELGKLTLRTGWVVKLPIFLTLLVAHNRIIGSIRAEVNSRLVMLRIGELTLSWNALLEEDRLAVLADAVTIGCHHTITVSVHGVIIHPVARIIAIQVQLASADHRVVALAVDHVFIDHLSVLEGVILLALLQLAEGWCHHLRVEKADLRGRLRIRGQSSSLTGSCGVVVDFLDFIEAESFLRSADITLNIRAFQLLLVRIHHEALQQLWCCYLSDQAQNNKDCQHDNRCLPCRHSLLEAYLLAHRLSNRLGRVKPDGEEERKGEHQNSGKDDGGNGDVRSGIAGAGELIVCLSQRIEGTQQDLHCGKAEQEECPECELTAR